MSADEIASLFEAAEARFEPGRVGRDLTFYFSLGHGPGERWTVWVGPERFAARQGKHVERADCVVKTTMRTFLRVAREGHIPGPLDFLSGRIRSNDPLLLRELQRALDL